MSYSPIPPENNLTIILLVIVSALVALAFFAILAGKALTNFFQ